MDRDFERFNAGPNEAPQLRVLITLSEQRVIRINRNAYERMGRPPAVRLYYSRERDTIALEATSPRLNEAFPVGPNGASGYRINAAPFCRHFNISVEGTIRFVEPEIKGTSVLLSLRSAISVARPARRRRK